MAEILYDLDISEFRHPADVAALKFVEKTIVINKLGELLQKKDAYLQNEIEYLGTGIKLTEKNAPEVWEVFKEAKEALDFEADVELYCIREFSSQFIACGTDRYFIGLPDIAVRLFTKPQLQFLFGRAITALKGKMAEMFSLSRFVESTSGIIPLVGDLLLAPLGQWNRKAQLTLDRGGLLACQDYNAAMKYLIWLSGVPTRDLDSINIHTRVDEIVRSMQEDKGIADAVGNLKNTVFSSRGLYSRERFVELYNWYESGTYAQIIQAHT